MGILEKGLTGRTGLHITLVRGQKIQHDTVVRKTEDMIRRRPLHCLETRQHLAHSVSCWPPEISQSSYLSQLGFLAHPIPLRGDLEKVLRMASIGKMKQWQELPSGIPAAEVKRLPGLPSSYRLPSLGSWAQDQFVSCSSPNRSMPPFQNGHDFFWPLNFKANSLEWLWSLPWKLGLAWAKFDLQLLNI